MARNSVVVGGEDIRRVITRYLLETRMHKKDFCRRCGISLATLYFWYSGRVSPRALNCLRIENETGGMIMFEDLTDKPRLEEWEHKWKPQSS